MILEKIFFDCIAIIGLRTNPGGGGGIIIPYALSEKFIHEEGMDHELA